jgi:hypothetical protein
VKLWFTDYKCCIGHKSLCCTVNEKYIIIVIMDAQTTTIIKELFAKIIEKNINPDAYIWLLDKASQSVEANNNSQLNLTFTAIPRKTGKKEIVVEESDMNQIHQLIPGFSVQNWTIDRLSRVWLLMQLEADEKANYIRRIENLFLQAEMNEQVALYSSLPFLAYPQEWIFRCSEGIRNNIGTVQEAVMYQNPYPSKYLDEPAWNQLVMKAFFADKDVCRIFGLDERANKNLALIIFDYINERWAAHRAVNPQLWRLTGKFIDESNFFMVEKLFKDNDRMNQKAAALVCVDNNYEPARLLLQNYPKLESDIRNNVLTWNTLS